MREIKFKGWNGKRMTRNYTLRERVKGIILKRTGIPKGARNPTRDAIVILGEQLVELIDNKSYCVDCETR